MADGPRRTARDRRAAGDPLSDPRLGEVKVLIPPLMRNAADEAFSLRPDGAAKSLEYVQALSAGVDNIAYAVPEGVLLCSVRGAYDELMAELLLTGILSVYKEIPHYVQVQEERTWAPSQVRVVQGKTVLYVGYGSIRSASNAIWSRSRSGP